MGVLRVRVNGVWEDVVSPAEPPMDEVWIGPAPPDPGVATYELWVDIATYPPVLKAEMPNGVWEPVGDNEVHVGVEDPYVLNPNSKAELWHDTSIGGGVGKLKVRRGGQWFPVAEFTESEVEIGPGDPVAAGIPAGTTELWVDSSVTPIVLKAWVNGGWQMVSGPDVLPAPQEVEIGPAQPRETTVELWYDTTNSPKGVLRGNNNGVWEDIGGANEVTVSGEDPYAVDPLSQDELWYSLLDQTLKARITNPQTGVGRWVTTTVKPGLVQPGLEYGKPPTIGISDEYSRSDHEHGTPQPEVHVGATDPYTYASPIQADLWYDTSV